MADLLHTLMEAGLDPLDAQQIVNAVDRNEGLPAQADAILQDARRAWWSAEHVPADYKRLLDASVTEQASVIPPDASLLKKSLTEQLGRFAQAGMLMTPLARLSVRRHLDLAEVPTPLPDLSDMHALIKAHTDYQVTAQDIPTDLLGLYLDAALAEAMKGGPGSGNHGHRGRPGERGGSAAGARIATQVTVDGEVERLAKAGITEDDLKTLFDLGLPNTNAVVHIGRYDGGVNVEGSWRDTEGNYIGLMSRTFYPDEHKIGLDMLSLSYRYTAQGTGKRVAEKWFAFAAEHGYTRAELTAGMSVGRYAWAKEGAQYADPDEAARQTQKFAAWLKGKQIQVDDLPVFHNPQDVANYRHPGGVTLTDKQIRVDYLQPGNYPLGKAYMLDLNGHGEWDAVLDLTRWQGSPTKAALPLPKGDQYSYIDLREKLAGASDHVFWSQYLTDEEGAPIFGFQTDKTLPLKGGPGSGNHGHRGRPGERGGSMRQDTPVMHKHTEDRGTLRPDTLQAGFVKPTAEADLIQVLHGGEGWKANDYIDPQTGLIRYDAARKRDTALKEKVVGELAKDLNVPEEWANDFIRSWADSSNDNHLPSLTHQRVAAQVFGVQLSDWQRDKYKNAKARRLIMLQKLADDLFLYNEPIQSKAALADVQKWLTEKDMLPFESHIMERMQDSEELFVSNREWVKNKKDFLNLVGQVERESDALTRKAVHSIYNRTQNELERNGIKWVTLYRGGHFNDKEAKNWLVGESIKADTNALSSWSASEHTADKTFASQPPNTYIGSHRTGVVFSATVPASRVYALPVTGVGCLNEWEAVLIGGHPGDRVKVKTLYRQTRQTV